VTLGLSFVRLLTSLMTPHSSTITETQPVSTLEDLTGIFKLVFDSGSCSGSFSYRFYQEENLYLFLSKLKPFYL